MPGKRKTTMDILEILRRLRQPESDRAIAESMRIDRKTVSRYREWAQAQDLLAGPLPSLADLQHLVNTTLNTTQPPQNVSSVEPYREVVIDFRERGVEIAAIYERLQERGFTGSYSAVYRFVRNLEPPTPNVTVRVERRPGEEAQVDFGYAGKMIDPESGKMRKAWVFVMTLSWCRHQYDEFVFDQKVDTWLRLHRNAFNFFGGVPERIVVDNLKSAIVRNCLGEDPQAQQSYRELAEYYGFLIDPCRPRTPEHKGKVENAVHYVKRNFLGGRDMTTITQNNHDVLVWVDETAGKRVHGTTKEQPLARFEIERSLLQPLPHAPYDLGVWKQVKLHRDCYLVFEQSFYSAPFRLVGQQLWVRGGVQHVQIYTDDYKLVATHSRAQQPGQRLTNLNHLPAEKVPGLILTRDTCRQKAMAIGPSTKRVVERMLNHRPEDRLRTAGRLLRLAEKFGSHRLEAACTRALHFDDPDYITIKHILQQKLDREAIPVIQAPSPAQAFVRTAQELLGHLAGGVSWK